MTRSILWLARLRRLAFLTAAAALLATLGVTPRGAAQDAKKLKLLFSDKPDESTARPNLLLRPNLLQPIYVFIENTGNTPEDVTVEVRAGGDSVEGSAAKVTAAPGKKTRVNFGKAAVPMPGKEPVLNPIAAEPSVCVVSGGAILAEQKVVIANPGDYVNVTAVEFQPRPRDVGNVKNRLLVQMEAKDAFAGPRCRVELVLQPDRIPGLIEGRKEGRYAGGLNAAGDKLTLVADNLNFTSAGAGKNGLVYLNVDGVPRAFTFRTTFVVGDTPSSGVRVDQPVLRIRAPAFAPPSTAFPVGLEIDNAPTGAVAELLVESGEGARESEPLKFTGDRRERFLFAAGGVGGCLYFKPEVQDWVADLDMGDVFGKRLLKLSLRDGEKAIPAVDSRQVGLGKDVKESLVPAVTLAMTLDATKPENVKFVDFPATLEQGTMLPIKATGRDPESGIKSVLFFVGKPTADGKLPPDAITAEGKLTDEKSQIWTADLPVPSDKTLYEASVRFTNGAGLSATETVRIQLLPAKGATAGPDGKVIPAGAKPSSISGQVVEGTRPQPNLEVVLRDDKNNIKATTKTDTEGKFQFKDVVPGAYKVTAAKPAAKTKGETPVSVGVSQDRTGVEIKMTR
jgi:hypothetical protein